MRTGLVLLLSVIMTCKCKSQDSSGIFGKWRVVVMDNGVRYDYKTGTYTVSRPLQDSLVKWKDGGFDLNDHIIWAGSCFACYYVFKPAGIYQEIRETDIRWEGTFSLVPKDSLIRIAVSVQNRSIPKEYKYTLVNERLILKIPSFFIKEKLILELERVD